MLKLRGLKGDRDRLEGRRRMWSGRLLAKYWAMQLPATAMVIAVLFVVEDGFGWPQWLTWSIVLAWVAKDAALYPLVWRSYDPGYPSASPYRMEGATGIAVDRIGPSGHVRVAGELWRAETARGTRSIERGEKVRVTARSGLTLLVEPAEGR